MLVIVIVINFQNCNTFKSLVGNVDSGKNISGNEIKTINNVKTSKSKHTIEGGKI